MCKLWGLQIRIISSWSNGSLDYIHNDLKYINKPIKDYYVFEKKAFDIIYKYLNEYIIGISSGNKERDIKNAIQDKFIDNVFVIEDTDYSANCNIRNHSYYIKSEGYISNRLIYEIGKILNKIP
jgi:phage FluMu gp28-like protein